MPKLSIIVPLFDDVHHWEETLISVLQNRPEDSEILVPHVGPYDDPYDLSAEVRLVSVSTGAGAAAAINSAVEVAESEVLHTLLAGVTVEEGWCDAAVRHFDEPSVGAVAPMMVSSQDEERVCSVGVAYRSGGSRRQLGAGRKRKRALKRRWRPTSPDLQAAFFRKQTFVSIGGLSERVGDALSDVDAGMSLRALGMQCRFEPQSVVTFGGAAQAERPSFARGRNAERLFWRHAPTAGWTRSLLLHPFSVVTEFASSIVRGGGVAQLAGRLCGSLELLSHLRHWRRLSQLAAPKANEASAGSVRVEPSNLRINPINQNVRRALTESAF